MHTLLLLNCSYVGNFFFLGHLVVKRYFMAEAREELKNCEASQMM